MLSIFRSRIRRFCSRIRWFFRWHPKAKVIIRGFEFVKNNSKRRSNRRNTRRTTTTIKSPNHSQNKPIRIASFNAALFTLAPAVSDPEDPFVFTHHETNPTNTRLKSILKQSPLFSCTNNTSSDTKLKQKVSINLPENEISSSMRSPISFPATNWMNNGGCKTILDVLKEVDADVIALQDVKATEERKMSPLSDLAEGLGMYYVFGESWAPEYGNAILSKWPIKTWKVQRIYDDSDFRNVLKATIEIPWAGLLHFYCTQLDHLDENWRIKQINSIINSSDHPHILAGGLNSLDSSDYSLERWTNIVKYFEEIGKPTPKAQVTNFLKEKQYIDAKDYPGECEPVVMIAKGQSKQMSLNDVAAGPSKSVPLPHLGVQGTCKYGTRIDYIMASKGLPYKFMEGSYSVVSSKGTSDHHLVKVDIVKIKDNVLKKRKIRERKS